MSTSIESAIAAVPATTLLRDPVAGDADAFGDGRDAFIVAYVIVVNSVTETLYREIVRTSEKAGAQADANRRTEVRAAVWATIHAALGASMLKAGQQRLVLDALGHRLDSHWNESLCERPEVSGRPGTRASHYLKLIDFEDPVATSMRIVELLIEATGVDQDLQVVQARLLAGLLAHRIVSDVWLFNDWEARGKLNLHSRSSDSLA